MKNKITNRNFLKVTIVLIVASSLIISGSTAVLSISKKDVPNSEEDYRDTGTTIYVDDDNTEGPWDGTQEYPFRYIQDGINASTDGDTVFVFNGIYYENLSVNKIIDLIGEDKDNTIIDGNGNKTVVYISVDRVNISEFTIRGSENTQSSKYGILVKSDHCIIENNIIINNLYGILFRYAQSHQSHITIKDNTIANNEKGIWNLFGNKNNITENIFIDNTYGIHFGINGPLPWKPNGLGRINVPFYNDIFRNSFYGNDRGIYLIDSVPNNITENIITASPDGVGIYVYDCIHVTWGPLGGDRIMINSYDNLHAIGNTITYNKWGIFLVGSSHNFISENTIVDNNYGIYLCRKKFVSLSGEIIYFGSKDNTIIDNNITNCTLGIWYGPMSDDNFIINNIINGKNNTDQIQRGIRIKGSENNIITKNTIVDNNGPGILLRLSESTTIAGNTIANSNLSGIKLRESSNNNIFMNTITNNIQYGVELINTSNDNIIYHNNFIFNNQNYTQAYDDSNNIWNESYPSGGNYWSDFDEPDEGAYDNNSDGIVDSPYNISGGNNQDFLPLMNLFYYENRPPYQPSSPSPEDGANDVDVETDLSWTGGDPDSYDIVTYDIYFGSTNPPPLVASHHPSTTHNPGTLYYDKTYYWKIVAWDIFHMSNTSDEWEFTTESEFQPDLECDGSLSWTDVKPGATVEGSFTVENSGDPTSELNWEIESYPDWGTWTFTPSSGEDLTPEDGPVTIEVSVVAPDEQNEEFEGEVKIVNTDDPDDYCIIGVSLATPVNQHSILSRIIQFLENLIHHFPLLERILELISALR